MPASAYNIQKTLPPTVAGVLCPYPIVVITTKEIINHTSEQHYLSSQNKKLRRISIDALLCVELL